MSKPATKTVRYYILSAIGIAIMLFFRFLPPMGTVTELGMNVLGIFLGAIWCFSTVGTFWPALLALVLFGIALEMLYDLLGRRRAAPAPACMRAE